MRWKSRLKRAAPGEAQGVGAAPAGPDAAPALRAMPDPAPQGAEGAHARLVEELRQRLVALAEGKLRAEEIHADGHIFDCGYVDSLSAVSFIAQIEQHYGARIEDMELIDRLSTLDALAAHIREQC